MSIQASKIIPWIIVCSFVMIHRIGTRSSVDMQPFTFPGSPAYHAIMIPAYTRLFRRGLAARQHCR